MLMRLLQLLTLLLVATLAAADYPLQIIELKSRPVEEVIPIIKPFVGEDGAVTGMRNQLIIRTSPSNMEEIRKILQRIDRPARQLMIYVRQGSVGQGTQDRISAGIKAGDDERHVTVGDAPGKPGVRMHIKEARTRSHLDATHRIQTLEGKPAFIETGRAFPVKERSLTISGNTVHRETTTRYYDATTGFYVTPHLAGDRVTLHISPFMTRPGTERGTYDVQSAETTVSGNLGQWIPVGGVSQSDTDQRSGILKRHQTQRREDRQILLLVEEITR